MKFSPLKRNIVLLIIRDYEMAETIDMIKEYLNISTEQVFYIIDYLIDFKWIVFEEGKLLLTHQSNNMFENLKLNSLTLDMIEGFNYIVNEDPLKDYIPKKA